MAKRPNLTPVRKAELKKEILEALEQNQPKAKKAFRPAVAPKAIIKPLAVRPLAVKPAITTTKSALVKVAPVKKPVTMKKPEIKKAAVDKKSADKNDKKSVAKTIAKEPLKPEVKKILLPT